MCLSQDCQHSGSPPTTAFFRHSRRKGFPWTKCWAQCHHPGPTHPNTFAPSRLTLAQLLRVTKGRPYLATSVLGQAEGDWRRSSWRPIGTLQGANKLVLCAPLRPAPARGFGGPFYTCSGVDRIGAGRRMARSWGGLAGCLPTEPHISCWGLGVCRVLLASWMERPSVPGLTYSSLPFDLPLAVTSFSRYSKLVEATGRRFLMTLVSMYFDVSHITDWKSAGASAQWAFTEMNIILGTPFAAEKKQHLHPTPQFWASILTSVPSAPLAALPFGHVRHCSGRRKSRTPRSPTAFHQPRPPNSTARGLWRAYRAIKDRQYSREHGLSPLIQFWVDFGHFGHPAQTTVLADQPSLGTSCCSLGCGTRWRPRWIRRLPEFMQCQQFAHEKPFVALCPTSFLTGLPQAARRSPSWGCWWSPTPLSTRRPFPAATKFLVYRHCGYICASSEDTAIQLTSRR